MCVYVLVYATTNVVWSPELYVQLSGYVVGMNKQAGNIVDAENNTIIRHNSLCLHYSRPQALQYWGICNIDMLHSIFDATASTTATNGIMLCCQKLWPLSWKKLLWHNMLAVWMVTSNMIVHFTFFCYQGIFCATWIVFVCQYSWAVCFHVTILIWPAMDALTFEHSYHK